MSDVTARNGLSARATSSENRAQRTLSFLPATRAIFAYDFLCTILQMTAGALKSGRDDC